jgi:hypothetical protein
MLPQTQDLLIVSRRTTEGTQCAPKIEPEWQDYILNEHLLVFMRRYTTYIKYGLLAWVNERRCDIKQ